jgi:hypothetical protein
MEAHIKTAASSSSISIEQQQQNKQTTTVTAIILPELQISIPNHGNEVDPM